MCSGWELKMGTGGNGRHLTRDDDLMGQGPIGYCYKFGCNATETRFSFIIIENGLHICITLALFPQFAQTIHPDTPLSTRQRQRDKIQAEQGNYCF